MEATSRDRSSPPDTSARGRRCAESNGRDRRARLAGCAALLPALAMVTFICLFPLRSLNVWSPDQETEQKKFAVLRRAEEVDFQMEGPVTAEDVAVSVREANDLAIMAAPHGKSLCKRDGVWEQVAAVDTAVLWGDSTKVGTDAECITVFHTCDPLRRVADREPGIPAFDVQRECIATRPAEPAELLRDHGSDRNRNR